MKRKTVRRFTLVCTKFGYALYPCFGLNGEACATVQLRKGIKYVYGEDNPILKAKFWSAVSGLKFKVFPI